MYLDTGTIIAIVIALLACIFTIIYSLYIIRTQNEIIQRSNDMISFRRKQER